MSDDVPKQSGRDDLKESIQQVICQMMDSVIDHAVHQHPFDPEAHRRAKPLYAALVPDEIFMAAHFERRFVTPFGKIWQKLAMIAAQHHWANVQEEYLISGQVPETRLHRIEEVLNRSPKQYSVNWKNDLDYVLAGQGKRISTQVICDLFISQSFQKNRISFELKAPLPNRDQVKVAKEKLLKLYAMEPCPVDAAFLR